MNYYSPSLFLSLNGNRCLICKECKKKGCFRSLCYKVISANLLGKKSVDLHCLSAGLYLEEGGLAW